MSENKMQSVGLLVCMPEGPRAEAPEHLVFPAWLDAPGTLCAKLFDSSETAREHYVRYYNEANPQTQRNIFFGLHRAFLAINKEFPTREEMDLKYLGDHRDALMNAYADWRNHHNPIFDRLGLPDIYAAVNVKEGSPNAIVVSPTLVGLSNGDLPINFISAIDPLTAQRAFEVATVQMAAASMQPKVPEDAIEKA